MWYTDISKGFFAKAEQKFKDFRENMKFEVFNLEQSPLSQGIPLGYFDMVCATDVLHATRDLEETLKHLRQTLRPGGVICFTETLKPVSEVNFVFGLLEGYWRQEDVERRPRHCCVGEQIWEGVLKQTGFRDLECFKICKGDFGCLTAMAEPEVEVDRLIPSRGLSTMSSWVLFSNRSELVVMAKLANTLVASGNKVVIALKQDGMVGKAVDLRAEVETKLVCFGEEDEHQIESLVGGEEMVGVVYGWALGEKDQTQIALPFLHLAKTLVARETPPKLFVVTQGVYEVTEDEVVSEPWAATLGGMVKSLKNERWDLCVRCVDLEPGTGMEEMVKQVLFELAMVRADKEQNRLQVAYRGGVRYEPRLEKLQGKQLVDPLKLPPSTERYQLTVPDSGMVQDLRFDPLEVETVDETEVEVQIKACSTNFRDFLKPGSGNTVALEFAGVVTKVGMNGRWTVGDRVLGVRFTEPLLTSHLVLESCMVIGIPDQMTFSEAATLPLDFVTACCCLVEKTEVMKGDSVLIHSDWDNSLGLMATQLAKIIGVRVILSCGTAKEEAYLRSMGMEHVFRVEENDFEQNIMRMTNGNGVDAVLTSVTSPGMNECSLGVVAQNGRIVEVSRTHTDLHQRVKELRPDVKHVLVNMRQNDVTRCLSTLHGYLTKEQLKPVPFVKLDALSIRSGLEVYLKQNRVIGKVVVTMPEVSRDQGQLTTKVSLFNAQSTYLITGGLGGIGFEVCKWMLGLGATDIVLTGRQAPAPEIREQISKLQGEGFRVQVKLGDVGNPDQCRALIEEIIKQGKPLRGVMHCAGVLQDALYSSQTWNSFQATFRSKVEGTCNLHELTKNLPLEHFVVFSSVIALIGNPGQANHAAANCFEDAFINYRHSLGLPGLSINWGQWASVGRGKGIISQILASVSVSRMLSGLEAAMRQSQRKAVFVDFTSIQNLTKFCPTTRYYLDDKLIQKLDTSGIENGAACKAEPDKFWQEMGQADTNSAKLGVISTYIKKLVRVALRLDPTEKLNENVDIKELGADSLIMIELRNGIQNLLGSKVGVTTKTLKNCTTVQELVQAVAGKVMTTKDEENNKKGQRRNVGT